MIFSPMLVVSDPGPAALPFSDPNFDQDLCSATRGLTVLFLTVVRIRRVVFTLAPASLKEYETVVTVPSGLCVVVGPGRAEGSSNSGSSAQSAVLEEGRAHVSHENLMPDC